MSSSTALLTSNPAGSIIDTVTIDPLGVNVSFTPGRNDLPLIDTDGIGYISSGEYINWRSVNTVQSHPTSGYSFDLWFANSSDINDLSSGSWATFNGKGNIALNPTKHTVFYDYDNQNAIGWKYGLNAVVNFTTVES